MKTRNKEISLSKFILQYIFLQIAIFSLVISIFFFYKYLSWKIECNYEEKNLNYTIEYNFSRYQQMINMIIDASTKINSSYQDTFDTSKYNKILELQQNFIKVDEILLVKIFNNKLNVISMYGKEDFAILPNIDFFYSIISIEQSKINLVDDVIFIVKHFDKNFVVLKLDSKDFTKQISSRLALKGTFEFSIEHGVIPPLFNLRYKYMPPDFYVYLVNNIQNLAIIWIIAFCNIMFTIGLIYKYFTSIIKPILYIKESKIDELSNQFEYINNIKSNLDSSLFAHRDFINSFLMSSDWYTNEDDKNTRSTLLSKLISNSKQILIRELIEGRVNCEIVIIDDFRVSSNLVVILNILIVNYLFKSVYRTPKNGKVTITAVQRQSEVLIQIKDNGFICAEKFQDEVPFYFEDDRLNEMSFAYGFKIIQSNSTENNLTEIAISQSQNQENTIKSGEVNVIKFPGK